MVGTTIFALYRTKRMRFTEKNTIQASNGKTNPHDSKQNTLQLTNPSEIEMKSEGEKENIEGKENKKEVEVAGGTSPQNAAAVEFDKINKPEDPKKPVLKLTSPLETGTKLNDVKQDFGETRNEKDVKVVESVLPQNDAVPTSNEYNTPEVPKEAKTES